MVDKRPNQPFCRPDLSPDWQSLTNVGINYSKSTIFVKTNRMRILPKNGKIYDGTGNEPFSGDILIDGDKYRSPCGALQRAHTASSIR